MILRSSPASPFGRKVKIVAHLVGLMDAITVEQSNTLDENDTIRQQNPLGKIPALLLDDGRCLFDSRVICEFLAAHSTGLSVFPTGPARWDALRLQALCDGLIDAAILCVYEKRLRPEDKYHQGWIDHQTGKIERALAELEPNQPHMGGAPHIGHVTLAVALGYLDFRFAGNWRESHPNLVAWLGTFEDTVPAYAKTVPHD